LDLDSQITESRELKLEMNKQGFWNDQERAVNISKQVEELDSEINRWQRLAGEIKELEEFVAMAQKEGDTSIAGDAEQKYRELAEHLERLEFYTLFSGRYDRRNCVISIHAGTGGVDAQDWAEMLERMFLRFAEKMGWRTEVLDRTPGSEAGLKSVTLDIRGRWAYGYLKSENGVHRLVRISPFDAEGMRHTSFALVEVLPELPEAEEIELKEEDLRLDTFRSSGPGGQGVNTTDSAVRLTHLPTGIVVTCQNERSQHQNRETAEKLLKAKLHQLREKERQEKEAKLKGGAQTAEWGKQIRSYVFQPYQMVKDHRTGEETADVAGVMDGGLSPFMEAYLRWLKENS
jgi:peptide chain release factor 2